MIKMKLNSGEAPDIIDYNIPAVYDIVDPASNFADLSDEAWVDSLLIPDNVTNKDDGKIYGFPFLSVPGTHGFIYNEDVFEKAGITDSSRDFGVQSLDAVSNIRKMLGSLLSICREISSATSGVNDG